MGDSEGQAESPQPMTSEAGDGDCSQEDTATDVIQKEQEATGHDSEGQAESPQPMTSEAGDVDRSQGDAATDLIQKEQEAICHDSEGQAESPQPMTSEANDGEGPQGQGDAASFKNPLLVSFHCCKHVKLKTVIMLPE
jgi:hypothetical protein